MNLTRTQYRDYVLAQSDDRQRQALSHRSTKPDFIRIIERVLNEYELAEQFQAAKTGRRSRLKILDVGCGEGLYLHDVAELLEEQDLHQAATFYGIDLDQVSIDTAIEYSKVSNPPRPYLNFYIHDLRQPLQNQPGLFVEGQHNFDLIYARQVLSFLPEAQQNLTRLYQALVPGGVIYTCDIAWHQGADGYLSPHPALTPFLESFSAIFNELNGGVEVALAQAGWLREGGATLVQALPDKMVHGGTSKAGTDALRTLLLGVRNASPRMVAQGKLSQPQIDRLLAQLYQELGPQCSGFLTFIHTLARKPLC
jgi:2-polyprenyl-3-methyl-5-hydroxy-6-metoxy-1,4-benzoquinol methylase